MAMAKTVHHSSFHLWLAVMVSISFMISINSHAQDPSELTLDYYDSTCPNAQKIVRQEMECAVGTNPRNAASILRLHFHDCFVQGCDGSVLLDDTYAVRSEKGASQSVNSLIGFELVDRIKTHLESECPGIVSCADLLTIAARDAVILVGGPYWDVPVGRKDSKTASIDSANSDIPRPEQGLDTLISNFLNKGLSVTDMVALSGAHTIGMARCVNFRERVYGNFKETSADDSSTQVYLNKLKSSCPLNKGDDNISAMDNVSPTVFDTAYFEILQRGEGLLNSDQVIYTSMEGFETADLVKTYASDKLAFFKQFSDSMVKLGNITNPAGGEVRKICRYVNA